MENNNTALNGVKMMIADGIVTQEAAEKYFPELKKSKDEREQLIEFLWDLIYKGSSFRYKREDFERWKDWLEKQGNTDSIIEKAKTEKQRVIITETDGRADIDWDTRSLEDVKKLLECGLQYINTELEKQDKQILANSTKTCEDEQKTVESRGMNLVEEKMTPFQREVFGIIDLDIENEQGLKQVCDKLLTLASNEIKRKSAEWSDEDEEYLRRAINAMKDTHPKTTDWLKSIKERVACEAICTTTKQWSEDEESIINKAESWLDTLCDYLKDSSPEYISDIKDVINKLKSLKDRIGG